MAAGLGGPGSGAADDRRLRARLGRVPRVRSVLAEWGYRLGRGDDKLLPMVVCQVFLLYRSPHIEDLSTELFDQIRREQMLPQLRSQTLHAVQRAVAAFGFCDPPRRGRQMPTARGGATVWAEWVDRWHATSPSTPRTRGRVRADLLKVRPMAVRRVSRGCRFDRMDSANLCDLDRGCGPDGRRRLRAAHGWAERTGRQAARASLTLVYAPQPPSTDTVRTLPVHESCPQREGGTPCRTALSGLGG